MQDRDRRGWVQVDRAYALGPVRESGLEELGGPRGVGGGFDGQDRLMLGRGGVKKEKNEERGYVPSKWPCQVDKLNKRQVRPVTVRDTGAGYLSLK